MKKMILIKYAELSTKGSNRHKFIKQLAMNIENKLVSYKYETIYTNGRMYIYTDFIEEVKNILKDVTGISSIVVSYQVENDIEIIKEAALSYLKGLEFKTFKIETKRRDKDFFMDTIELNPLIGSYIMQNISNITVDVKKPDVKLYVEIRSEGTYLYTDEIKGIGGYPQGIQNKGLLMLSGGIDSPVAGYLAMTRGIEIECIYFESPPHTSLKAQQKVVELTRLLSKYTKKIKLHIVPFTLVQEAIYKNVPINYNITIMRRMMYRISVMVAQKNRCVVLINGENIGQVASQTLTSMACINEVTTMPVIRPVSCYSKEEIITVAKNINTYETSILPYEDCCTIFVPKHPVINPSLYNCLRYEKAFDYESLINDAVERLDTKIITFNDEVIYEENLL